MDRYDYQLELAFFSRGVVYANLKTAGNMPNATDLLNSVVVINGARRSTLSLSRRVENGLLAHCLSGRWRMAVHGDVCDGQSVERR